MKKRPSVSVIMALYNGAAYLSPQLDSIVFQLAPEDEFLIIDDGSTDESLDIIRAYAQTWPQIQLITEGHRGVKQSFARGLELARGDILFLADQDDVWHPAKLSKVVKRLAQEEGPAVVLHDALFVNEKGRPLGQRLFTWRHVKTGFWKNLWRNSYMGCCMALTKELKPYVLPIPEQVPMHDQWIGLMGERFGHVILLQEPLLYYRRHEATVTKDRHQSLIQMVKDRIHILFYYSKRTIGER